MNVNQPFEAFNVPVTIVDPGPDGVRGNGDDGSIAAFNLDAAHLALTPLNVTMNVPNSDDDYYNWEVTGTKRMSNRWSLLAAYSWTKSSTTPAPTSANAFAPTRSCSRRTT